MLEGIKRSKNSSDSRLPITGKLLCQIINILPHVCFSEYEASLFSSAFSLAYHGFLRVGELVLSKKWQSHQVIGVENICFFTENNQDIIKLYLPFSKTDQLGQGCQIKITETKEITCPVYLLRQYLLQRPKVKGPLYCHFGGSSVTRYQFSSVLNKALRAMGVSNYTSFKTHSFRIGAASSYSEKGVSEQDIKRLGRWKSDAFKGYIRLP